MPVFFGLLFSIMNHIVIDQKIQKLNLSKFEFSRFSLVFDVYQMLLVTKKEIKDRHTVIVCGTGTF